MAQFIMRDAKPLEVIETVTIADIQKTVQPVRADLIDTQYGMKVLFFNKDHKHLSVRVSSKFKFNTIGGDDMLDELIDNAVIYVGVSKHTGEETLTFGAKPTGNKPLATRSMADLLKKGKFNLA